MGEVERREIILNPPSETSSSINSDDKLKEIKKKYDDLTSQMDDLMSEVSERSNRIFMDAEISNLIMSQVFNASNDGIWAVDGNHKVIRVNNTLLEFLHKKAQEVIGHKCQEFFPHICSGAEECPRNKILKGEPIVNQERAITTADGKKVIFMVTFTPLSDLEGIAIGMVETFTDITERKQAEQELQSAYYKLEQLAAKDGLTKLPNRRSFDEYLEKEWRRQARAHKPISLIMCDVDFFKSYNDTYGHQAGDACLRSVAQAIQFNVRRGGDFAARYGGEEFALVMPETDSKGAWHVADKLRRTLEDMKIPHSRSKAASFVTMSCGMATMIPSNENSPQMLIQRADQGLYKSKSQGRNCVHELA
jgi:diguanylate cyclase (GGDEF)-like protein/PAS domain S-box-containing protein